MCLSIAIARSTFSPSLNTRGLGAGIDLVFFIVLQDSLHEDKGISAVMPHPVVGARELRIEALKE